MPDSNPSAPLHATRRENLHFLLREFSKSQLSSGAAAKGIEGSFALHLAVSPATLSHIKSSRNISDKMAKQIETSTGKVSGWLDTKKQAYVPTSAEAHFLDLARAAWRTTDAPGRRRMLRLALSGFEGQQQLVGASERARIELKLPVL